MIAGWKNSGGEAFSSLKGRLIVSCQADPGDPMDDLDTVTRMARSVLRGGAAGLRSEGERATRAFRGITAQPLIGMVKTKDAKGEVYITPTFASARAVVEAGCDIVALDCTLRRLSEAEPWPELIRRIHEELDRPVLADIASLEDGLAAEEAGADAVATTLYGYTAETAGIRSVSWPLLESLIGRMRVPVIAEGHIQQPDEVRRALGSGAYAALVGSAITRPETITARFVAATRDGVSFKIG
ncbi:N-acetylmannosamine-6-phosphate 2-epimerase [Edaphobacter albus]|uniref:N-acetylmannosamine-6-phosphate 2-epimerase n=1 Tax=Edaphobacter sp. 4G125 TaxID=2763071 RepID=UPI00164914FF|nr:N-acetylmannosamine-6-phosphate 2-epimerase [Edaphobacter sp. 4G125]QNI37955.1 N-acetylmannosamine-6-phosphate 2-epimerase [Edaphobacter sp. 4G125]